VGALQAQVKGEDRKNAPHDTSTHIQRNQDGCGGILVRHNLFRAVLVIPTDEPYASSSSLLSRFRLPEQLLQTVPVAFGFLLPRVYSLTMLYNINSAGGLLKHYEQETELRKEGELDARVEPGIFTTMSISRVSQNHMITMSIDASTGNVSELIEDVKDVEVRIG
jgi:hypothetical protein